MSRVRAAMLAMMLALCAELVVVGTLLAVAPDEACAQSLDGAALPAATWPVVTAACIVGFAATIAAATVRPSELSDSGRRLRRWVAGLTGLVAIGPIAVVALGWTVYACWE
jgi:hypothetical protein